MDDPATERSPDTEIEPPVAVASREPLGKSISEARVIEEPVSEIEAPTSGVVLVVPARRASSKVPVVEIEWATARAAVKDGVAMRRDPVLEKVPSERADTPLVAEMFMALIPLTENALCPNASDLADISSVPPIEAGEASVVTVLGFENVISVAAIPRVDALLM